jgi:hypothetical protein
MRLGTHTQGRRNKLLALGSVVLALACAAPASALASSTDPVFWEPTPTEFWTVNETALMGALQNGQCIQWAADKRPDIVEHGIEAIVSRELANQQPEDLGDWSARYWAEYAQEAGIPTGRVPRQGAVAVFQPGVLGAAAPNGHVAYVEKVTKKGRVYVSQMHAPVLGKVTYRWLTAKQARTRGLTYIYR